MHTYVCKSGTRMHYNSGLSGDIHVSREGAAAVTVDGGDMLEFLVAIVVTMANELEIRSDH